jgi:hypothetical protein
MSLLQKVVKFYYIIATSAQVSEIGPSHIQSAPTIFWSGGYWKVLLTVGRGSPGYVHT